MKHLFAKVFLVMGLFMASGTVMAQVPPALVPNPDITKTPLLAMWTQIMADPAASTLLKSGVQTPDVEMRFVLLLLVQQFKPCIGQERRV